jgi:WD40 repeat protein
LQTLEVPGAVTSLAFSPDNQKLAVATKDKALMIFGPPLPPMNAQPGNELILHQRALAENMLTRIVFDRDNRSVWATDDGGHINQWAYASPVQTRQFNHGGPVYGVAVSGDGKTVVSCSTDQTVRIWDVVTGQQKAAMSGHQGAVHAVALSPEESLIVSSGADRTVRLWDVAGGRLLKQLATFDETMYAIAIPPDGKTVAVGGADRKVHVINLLTGAEEKTLEGHTDFIHGLAFNPQGTRLLSYGYAGQLRVWDPTDGKHLFETKIGRIGNSAQYAGDGQRVLLSNGDGTARVFDLPAPAR